MNRQPGAGSTKEAKQIKQNPYREFFNLLTHTVQSKLIGDNMFDSALHEYAQTIFARSCIAKQDVLA